MTRAADIAANLEEIRARITEAARAAGRAPDEVTLVAVSKTFPADDVRLAYEAGQRDFGENYAQELVAKREALADLADLRWHFIGALQSNKAKFVVPGTTLVHAVDRASLAEALSKRALASGTIVDLLLEVNVAGEASKAGIAPDEVDALTDAVSALAGLHLRGLMCIPPPESDPERARQHFHRLREIRDRLSTRVPTCTQLSMGMSGDFEAAIAEGASHVRVGTAIFGGRARKA